MAKMYPDVFPIECDESNPEFIVYQCLKMLPDTYSIFYSRRFKGDGLFGKPECEIDFIISNQRDVIICLEVKGGILSYDGVHDRWFQNGKVMPKSPDRQATEATHCLINVLFKEIKNANVDWALCFPQCSIEKSSAPTGVPLSRILDESRLVNINKEVLKLEGDIRSTFKKKGMSHKEASELFRSLTAGIGFVQILGVRIAREAKQIIQVTEEQCDTLADLEINSRMIIHGSAGTGKTILAQEYAKRQEARGRSVLLLFYNRGIASMVRFAFGKKSTVSVSTFSSFAKRLIEINEPAWWDTQKHKDDDFWQLILPAKLLEINTNKQPKYEVIIIDEGQDFKPEWYEYLETILMPSDDSQLFVFLDEHQDIFGHWKHFPSSIHPAKKVLTKNCRNTKTIVDFINCAYPTKMKCFDMSPIGVPIIERIVKNDVDEQTQIVKDIKSLVSNEGIRPESIVIMLNSSKEESSLAETKSIAGFPLISTYGRFGRDINKIFYSTIEIFKGLETDVLLLVLGPCLSEQEKAKAIYVQGSRAKHLLYVYHRDDD